MFITKVYGFCYKKQRGTVLWENAVFFSLRNCSKSTLLLSKAVRKLFIGRIKFFVYVNSFKRFGLKKPVIKVSYETLKICRRRH
jgi:hypothetical protein